MWMAIAFLLWAVSIVCAIIILIEAFKSEVWKGIVSLICGLYMLYFAIVEFQHPNKWLIIMGWLVPSILGGIVYTLFAAAAVAGAMTGS